MKKILLSLSLIVICFAAFGQATNDYRSAATGNWNTLATWQRYNGATWVTPTAGEGTPNSTDGVITILSGHTVTITASVTVDQTTVDAGGQITINAAQTLTINNGTGTDLSVSGTVLTNSISNNAGFINNGAIAFNAGGTYQHNVDGEVIPTATWNATSNCNITGVTVNMPTGDAQSFGNFTWNCSGQGTNNIQFNTTITTTGTLTISNTGTTGRLELGNAAGNTVANLLINGGQLRIGSNTARTLGVTGNVNISSGTLLMSSGNSIGTLNVAGNFSHTAGTITESGSASGLIVFNGSAAQSLTGGGTVSGVINYTINNTSATGVTLATAYTIANTLTFTDGYLYTTTGNLLTISAGATTPGASNASFVQGPIRKNGNTAYTFPVGNSGIYAALTISAPGAVGDGFTAEYFRGLPPDHANRISALTQLSTVDYWRLDRPAGASNVNVTLNWTPTSYDASLLPYGANSTVALHSTAASKWNSQTRSAFTGGPTAGTVTWNAVSNYNDFFAIGVSTIGATGLPVTFANVNAKQTNGGVLVSFSNLTESDLNYYEVERSTDGRNFTAIGKVQPKGNDYGKWDYSFTDAAPASKSYYRIKSVEFSNTTKYSVILKVSSERTANAFVVYPNPVQNKVVTLQANNIAAGAYSVTIVNSNGQQVFSKTMNFQAGSVSQSIELPANVKPGMYMLRIENAGTRSVTSLFVQ